MHCYMVLITLSLFFVHLHKPDLNITKCFASIEIFKNLAYLRLHFCTLNIPGHSLLSGGVHVYMSRGMKGQESGYTVMCNVLQIMFYNGQTEYQ